MCVECICVCAQVMWVYVLMCAHVCESQRLTSRCVLYCFLLYLFLDKVSHGTLNSLAG